MCTYIDFEKFDSKKARQRKLAYRLLHKHYWGNDRTAKGSFWNADYFSMPDRSGNQNDLL